MLTADPDQTIYGFRGAVAERLDEVIDEFPDVSVHHLTTNYRNSQHIAEVVESLRTGMPVVPHRVGYVAVLITAPPLMQER
ncbi:ATP-dependent DNA helicase [Cutibacterium acnes JCM 18918]|nr:ATP-dependent DNA helicase [Cutibacterium acnes JCM 18918]